MITRWSAEKASELQLQTSLLPLMDSSEQTTLAIPPFSITCAAARSWGWSGVKRRIRNAFNPRESTCAWGSLPAERTRVGALLGGFSIELDGENTRKWGEKEEAVNANGKSVGRRAEVLVGVAGKWKREGMDSARERRKARKTNTWSLVSYYLNFKKIVLQWLIYIYIYIYLYIFECSHTVRVNHFTVKKRGGDFKSPILLLFSNCILRSTLGYGSKSFGQLVICLD